MNVHQLTILLLLIPTVAITGLLTLLWYNIRLKDRANDRLDAALAEVTVLKHRDEIEALKAVK